MVDNYLLKAIPIGIEFFKLDLLSMMIYLIESIFQILNIFLKNISIEGLFTSFK